MKVCTKCGVGKDEVEFTSDKRNSDGKHVYCKQCRKSLTLKWLEDHPMCSKCGERPHRKGSGWCSECRHKELFKDRLPKFKRSPNSYSVVCPKCGIYNREPYHSYCRQCKNASRREWAKRRKPPANPCEKRRKASARHYVNTMFKRRKITRGPCVRCGKPGEHFHHLDYQDRTMNVVDLCEKCHVFVEREKRRLTKIAFGMTYLPLA